MSPHRYSDSLAPVHPVALHQRNRPTAASASSGLLIRTARLGVTGRWRVCHVTGSRWDNGPWTLPLTDRVPCAQLVWDSAPWARWRNTSGGDASPAENGAPRTAGGDAPPPVPQHAAVHRPPLDRFLRTALRPRLRPLPTGNRISDRNRPPQTSTDPGGGEPRARRQERPRHKGVGTPCAVIRRRNGNCKHQWCRRKSS